MTVRLAGLTDTLDYLGLSGTSTTRDNLIYRLLDSGSVGFRYDVGGRQLYPATHYTQYVDIEWLQQDSFALPEYPIIHIDAVTNDTTAVAAADYYIWQDEIRDGLNYNPGIVMLDEGAKVGQYWPRSRKQIRVMWKAGFAVVPEDITQAIIDDVSHLYEMRDELGLESEKMGDYSYKRAVLERGQSKLYRDAVRRHRRIEVC